MNRVIYKLIWLLSECTGIGLGKYGPYVFHQMIGGEKPYKRLK